VDGVSRRLAAAGAAILDTRRTRGPRLSERARIRLLQLSGVLGILGAWEGVARAGWVDPLFVPAPSAVVVAFAGIGPAALGALGDTLLKTAIAYAIAAVVGVTAGIVLGSVRGAHDVLHPFVVALYGIPKILVLPWIVLLLGFGAVPAVVYGAIHGLFPIMVMVVGAVRDVDRTLLTVARSLGARPWQIYWKVILPAIVPSVVASLRLGIVFCLLGVLIVEMFAGVRGMGHVLNSLANGFQSARLFAATALVSAASIAIVLALDHVNERLSQWRG
jgi:NitT/TauT family transport system permease protein